MRLTKESKTALVNYVVLKKRELVMMGEDNE